MGKELKDRSISKEFLLTLAATTVSIVLTFGTTAVIDRKKQRDDKREMVMMVLYDMQSSLEEIEQCDEDLHKFVDLQVEAVSHPYRYSEMYIELVACSPMLTYTTTTENIFKTNIETINTIGNILFVETVSSFYDKRSKYKTEVVDAFFNEANGNFSSYELLSDFNSTSFPYISRLYYNSMKGDFERCKVLMKVSDQDMETFSKEWKKLYVTSDTDYAKEATEKAFEEKYEMDQRLREAREEGKKAAR